MTTVEEEMAVQSRWRLRSAASGAVYEALIRREFLAPEKQSRLQAKAVSGLVSFAFGHVPYYADFVARSGLQAGDIGGPEDLSLLPILSKQQVRDNWDRLHSIGAVRSDETVLVESSGTTGQPLKIRHCRRSTSFFSLLKQRELRWFRFDSRGVLGVIRAGSGLPPGVTGKSRAWPSVGRSFHTGPAFLLNVTSPIETQVEWLRRLEPHYLLSLSGSLEQLAVAFRGERRLNRLRGQMAISQELTDEMRRAVERVFRVPIAQNYGLNEVGIVAARCEAGRYHVHAEHCLVEILGPDGKPVPPGQRGKIVVTALNNRAMPLLRYDTDDMATVVEGPCDCGRTLPSFGQVEGRYSRLALLPAGVFNCVLALREALASLPDELAAPLQQFQIHHCRNNTFRLRLMIRPSLPQGLIDVLRRTWLSCAPVDWQLILHRVDNIEKVEGRKFEAFTSDLFPSRGLTSGTSGSP